MSSYLRKTVKESVLDILALLMMKIREIKIYLLKLLLKGNLQWREEEVWAATATAAEDKDQGMIEEAEVQWRRKRRDQSLLNHTEVIADNHHATYIYLNELSILI